MALRTGLKAPPNMSRYLTRLEYDELVNFKYTTFTIDEVICECNLKDLPIELAQRWLSKQSLKIKSTKNKGNKYEQIKRWVELATLYKELIYFYPNYCSMSPHLPRYILESGALDSTNLLTLKTKIENYWTLKSTANPNSLSLQEIIDICRVCSVINIKTEYLEFGVLDVERHCGYAPTQCHKFYLMFKYMKLASTNSWEYSFKEWGLISEVIRQWQSWLLSQKCDKHTLLSLVSKFLGIDSIHPVIGQWLWRLSYGDTIDYNTPFFRDYSYSKPAETFEADLEDSFKLLNIKSTASYSEAKKAYRELIKSVHPDINQGNLAATELTKDITNSWYKLKKHYERNRSDA